jgi:hypothetical protein
VFIGEDPEDVFQGRIQSNFVPPIDHYFRVVDVYPLSTFEMGIEYIDCFVEVEVVEITDDFTVRVDSMGRPYVEDFDDVMKPMEDIPVNTDTCTSPIFRPAEERNLP